MDIVEKVNKKNRDEMYKRAKRTSDQNDWAEAKRLRNLVQLGCTRARADFVKENIKKNMKKIPKFLQYGSRSLQLYVEYAVQIRGTGGIVGVLAGQPSSA